MIDLLDLQRALDNWPTPPPDDAFQVAAPRLASALDQAARGVCGPGDLAALIRDALRSWHEAHETEHLPAPIRVPTRPPWPDAAQWLRSSVDTAPGSEHLRIVAVRPWRPGWGAIGTESTDGFPAKREKRRPEERVAADPVWKLATGFHTYRSLEQREAVRTLLASAPDDTVLVLLPTGSGKSLVGLLHPLTTGPSMVTVVVVPTTSLALDQEEQLRAHLRGLGAPDAHATFAFRSGMTSSDRGDVLSRVRSGGQRVVFTSPESLFGALGDALSEAARAGRFGQFVVDEAHMVSSWGAEFRPDFQALAGFRRRLQTIAADARHVFRTVLMTATATASDVATLSDLFVDSGRALVAGGAVSLRPEVSYVAVESANAAERLERVKEALVHLPRPLFLYATKVDDALALADAVRESGVQRLTIVTGNSGDKERRHAIRALRGVDAGLPTADVAVGTSAFGLGIDIDDVRCVIHACLPESLDRYFQEAGRSGRDGRAALSLMLWTAADEPIAHGLSTKRLIGVDLARKHWSGMRRTSHTDGAIMWVELDALRIGLLDDSLANEQWNSRTLSSMVRAGLIRLVGSKRRDDGTTVIGVELLRHDLDAQKPWQDFEQMRRASWATSRQNLDLLLDIARGAGVCDALRDSFSVHDPQRLSADLVADDACGGCSGCAPPRRPPTPPLPLPSPHRTATYEALERLPTRDGVVLAVQERTRRWARSYGRLIAPASAIGVHHVICTPAVLDEREVQRALEHAVATQGLGAPLLTVLRDDPTDDLAYLADEPSLLLVGPNDPRLDAFTIIGRLPRPVIAVLPASHPSQARHDMTVEQMHPGAMSVAHLERRLIACQT